jgi:flagellar biosynthesis/type III secretory pathway protein FliH
MSEAINRKQTTEYQMGYHDGYKEGYTKAIEDFQVKKVFELAMKPTLILRKDDSK